MRRKSLDCIMIRYNFLKTPVGYPSVPPVCHLSFVNPVLLHHVGALNWEIRLIRSRRQHRRNVHHSNNDSHENQDSKRIVKSIHDTSNRKGCIVHMGRRC